MKDGHIVDDSAVDDHSRREILSKADMLHSRLTRRGSPTSGGREPAGVS
jgi:hypothetical protein